MKELIVELSDILVKETAIYTDILSISRDKTPIIVNGKVNELEKAVKAEQVLILKLASMESKRESQVEKISQKVGLKPEEITISSLSGQLGDEEKRLLEAAQDNIVKTIKELRTTNELNSKLIKNSLEYINFSLGLFTNSGMGDNNYSPNAETASKKARNLFDLKI